MAIRDTRLLSRGAEQLVVELQHRRQEDFDCDVLLIGSGYGGAVAASRLAGARACTEGNRPLRVWLVERGAERLPGRFPSRFSELAGEVRFSMQDGMPARGVDEGLFDLRLGGDVCVLLGNGLGGGSLINAGVMERPAPEVFEQGWPAGITAEALAAHYERSGAMLQHQTVPPERETRKLAALDELVQARGAGAGAERCHITVNMAADRAPTPAGVALGLCTRCGDCMTGCNQGAKASLDTNFLAQAWRNGLQIFCGAAVECIEPQGAGVGWRVRWNYTNRQLQRTEREGPPPIRARRVVLAAGALGSTEILLRSRRALGLRDGPDAPLGRRFSTNGDAIAATVGNRCRVGSVAEQEVDPAYDAVGEAPPGEVESPRAIGPTITGMVRVPATDAAHPALTIEEFAVPAALRQLLGEVSTFRQLFDIGTGRLDDGLPLAADPCVVYDDAIERVGVYGVMGDDGAAGRIDLPAVAGLLQPARESGVRIAWDPAAKPAALYNAAKAWLDGPEPEDDASPSPRPSVLLNAEALLGLAPMLTVHPLGGCAMGDDAESGVVNAIGQVFRADGSVHESLVVLDGSIVPRSLAINPAWTIAALADRAVDALCSDEAWNLSPPEADPTRGDPPQRSAMRRYEQPPSDATWTLRERLQGLAGEGLWARLEMEFDPVPGFRRALQLTRRTLRVRRADLTLQRVPTGTDELTLDDESAPVRRWKATLTGSLDLLTSRMPKERKPEDDRNADNGEDPGAGLPLYLTYRLAVRGVEPDAPPGWHVGALLQGRKIVHPEPADQGAGTSPWRELSEMEVALDGTPLGIWTLDLADLAERREPLLSLQALTTMPDALADIGALVGYGARRLFPLLVNFRQIDDAARGAYMALFQQRWPRAYEPGGVEPQVFEPDGGSGRSWRLSRFKGEGRPVVLLHGLGASGANYTHPKIGINLARFLHRGGRDVWVLDLSSSIANEQWRGSEEAARATVEQVALQDIPPAIERVCREAHDGQVDVIAHCMGAVMFVMATLGDPNGLHRRVHAAVLSQVSPLLRLSAFNRLRGFVASYLQQFLQVAELDATPELGFDEQGTVRFTEPGKLQQLVDSVLNTFPYPADDHESERDFGSPAERNVFRIVRHRVDAIFGQLFELSNLSNDTLLNLGALFGWVKVPMLAQAIHFARQEMVTDARGRNAFFSRARLRERFAFPVLIVHGQRNRVFDWRGSLRGLRLLRSLWGRPRAQPGTRACEDRIHYAPDERAQLLVFKNYGHLDSIVGERAHEAIFPAITEFLGRADALAAPRSMPEDPHTRRLEPPLVGPMLGAVRTTAEPGKVELWVLVHPMQKQLHSEGLVIAPVRRTATGPQPWLQKAARLPWPGRDAHLPEGEDARGFNVRAAAVKLVIDLGQRMPSTLGDTFALMTVHNELAERDLVRPERPVGWVEGGLHLFDAVKKELRAAQRDGRMQACMFSIPEKVRRAADQRRAGDSMPPDLTFALASCQYPPGLLDRGPAQATLRRLADDAERVDGPQFLLLAGDQVYADATAGVFDAGASVDLGPTHLAGRFDRIYELNWALPAFRRLVARLPIYPMLDDHEVRDNWQGPEAEPPPQLDVSQPKDVDIAALQAFDRFQGILIPEDARMSRAGSSSYCVFPGGVPLFVMDTRTRRTPRNARNVADASPLAAEDLAALLRGLHDVPDEIVKLVLLPVPILPPERVLADHEHPEECLRSDTWSGFPGAAGELMCAIRDRDIRRVVFLSGDSHLSSLSRFKFEVTREGRACTSQVVSVVASGNYAPWPFANQRADDLMTEGRLALGTGHRMVEGDYQLLAMSGADGYARITLSSDGRDGPVTLSVALCAGDGSTVEAAIALG